MRSEHPAWHPEGTNELTVMCYRLFSLLFATKSWKRRYEGGQKPKQKRLPLAGNGLLVDETIADVPGIMTAILVRKTRICGLYEDSSVYFGL